MCVRKATVEDKEAIRQLWKRYTNMLGGVQMGGLKHAIEAGTCHVAELDNKIVGFVVYNARKRDVGSTIYYIATGEDARNKGIGAALLWSVPCPIRLKVTADNESAIRFYEHHHMTRTAEETSRTGRLLYVYELKTLFIQVAGNNRKWPEICRTAGIAYGSRHDDQIRAWPTMIDINWKKFKDLDKATYEREWQKYVALVKQHKPIMAMVIDYEDPSQRREMYRQIRDIKPYVQRVMVCPKFDGAVAHIPAFCVIAVSVPSKYAGYIPPLAELEGKRIHLLGGSPVKQRKTYFQMMDSNYNIQIISMDGNSHTFAGGMVWRTDKWKKTDEHMPYYDIAGESAKNIGHLMNNLESITSPLFVA